MWNGDRRKLFWVQSSSMGPLDISEQISASAHRFCTTLGHGFWPWWLLEKWWLEPVQTCRVAEVSGLVQYKDARPLSSLLPAATPMPCPLLPNGENAFRHGSFIVEWIGSIMTNCNGSIKKYSLCTQSFQERAGFASTLQKQPTFFRNSENASSSTMRNENPRLNEVVVLLAFFFFF